MICFGVRIFPAGQRLTAIVPGILATILNETIAAGMVVLLLRRHTARLVLPHCRASMVNPLQLAGIGLPHALERQVFDVVGSTVWRNVRRLVGFCALGTVARSSEGD